MGRGMLIFVILMTTIFAGVLINLNNKMSEMPTVLVRNTLMREAENVSDFALRNAIRNANSEAFLNYHLGENTEEGTFEGVVHHTQVFEDEYRIGNCTIDSLKYSFFTSADHYEVRSYVTGEMQGIKVSRTAEMAFDYPLQGLSAKPNVLFLEMEKLILTGLLKAIDDFITWITGGSGYNNDVIDTSGNNHTTTIYSKALLAAVAPWGGAFSRYCVPFLGGYDGGWFGTLITPFGATYMVVHPDDTVANPIRTDNSFSLLCFAQIDKDGRPGRTNEQGTLMWVPSEPDSANWVDKPSAAIWFNHPDKTMHFTVTQEDGTLLDLSVDHDTYGTRADIFNWGTWTGRPILNSNFDPDGWHSYSLSYHNGVLKGYINGVRVRGTGYIDGEEVGSDLPQVAGAEIPAYPSDYGMSLGRRDIRIPGTKEKDYRYFLGLMDQMGMYDEALTDYEHQNWHKAIFDPVSIMYIKD